MMKSLLALLIGALLASGETACGGARDLAGSTARVSPYASVTTTTSSVIPPGQYLRGDGDADNPNDIDGNGDSDSASVGGSDTDNDNPTRQSYNFPDDDDKVTFAYGRPPTPAEKHAIARVARSYYAAASANNGAAACSSLVPSIARSIPEAYGQVSGPSYLRGGKTCQAIMSMLFKHFHTELAEAITVVEVRVKGSGAQVVLSSRKMRASSISLARQDGSWRVAVLLGQPLP